MVIVFFIVVFKTFSGANSLPHLCIYLATIDFTLIRDLDVLKDNFTMKLRVIRLWTLDNYYNKNELFSIELILMDEEGNKIQGYVPKAYIYKFKKLLKEGESFIIKSPNLAKTQERSFQLTNQLQKLALNLDSIVTPCDNFSGSVNGFDFVEYRAIIDGTVPDNMSLDVIGLVVVVGEMDARNADRKRHRIRIQIQDANGLQLDVNLWGDYGYTFLHYIQKNPNNVRIVIILQFAKISVWQDRRSVNTYYDVSKFIINSDIDDINVFKKRNKTLDQDGPHENSKSTFTYMKSNRSSENDDFLLNNDLKTIADIFEPVEGCNSQSFDVGTTDYESQDNKSIKDVISQTDDNVTPTNVFKSIATSPKKNFDTSTGLKRALEDVFVLDMNDKMSSSKATKVGVEDGQVKFLKVKLEK
ncbi:unnamed protein product [Lactuca saligna]|uniref:Replication protein A 70 kDa DNA-binding subunit B/D first OB fold domain-containing protein n=1 Tax=Lactuca saligna TaxID=75948 RepID=A0AA36E181_LACSI|nr:unnamed protein product [Lactuca saligna]